jgi:hypothetical protein
VWVSTAVGSAVSCEWTEEMCMRRRWGRCGGDMEEMQSSEDRGDVCMVHHGALCSI